MMGIHADIAPGSSPSSNVGASLESLFKGQCGGGLFSMMPPYFVAASAAPQGVFLDVNAEHVYRARSHVGHLREDARLRAIAPL